MRKIYTFSLSVIMLFLALSFSRAQTPMYNSSTSTAGGNNFPLNNSTDNECQWLYQPGAFGSCPAASITKVYLFPSSAGGPCTWTNLTIKMGSTSLTTLTSGPWITSGMTTVYSSTFTLSSWSTGVWTNPIVLTTPYTYDPTKGLIFELEQSGISSTGMICYFVNMTSTTNRMYGSTSSGSCTGADAEQMDLGIDVGSLYYNDAGIFAINFPTNPVTPGSDSVLVTIKNYGKKILTSATIKYSVDGSVQSPYSWTGSLAQYTASSLPVNIGTYTFTLGSHILKAWTEKPNGVADSNHLNDTSTVVINCCYPMHGTYTIDPSGSGSFTSFSAAVAALIPCGISGPVVFNVKPGTYSERVVIPAIMGASSTNTITFNGAGRTSTILSYTGSSMATASTLVLNGTSYIRFNNMRIENLGSTYARAIYFTGQANYNTIQNCNISVNTSYASSTIVAIESGASEGSTFMSTGNNANVDSILNCDIGGGYYGLCFTGTASNAVSIGNVFQGNTFHDQYYYSIYLYYLGQTTMRRNNINIGTRYNGAYGIYTYYCTHGVYDGNIIKPGQVGIWNYYDNMSFSGDSTVYINNIITSFNNTAYQTGIYFYDGYNPKIYHNSIYVRGTVLNSYSYAALELYYSYNVRIQNNILASNDTTFLVSLYPYPYGNPMQEDYNDYYYPMAGNFQYYNNSVYYSNLAGWQTSAYGFYTPHDVNSFEGINPNFVSKSDLHLQPIWTNLKAPALWIPWDVDGQTRCKYEATLGADESTAGGAPPKSGFVCEDTLCLYSVVSFMNTSAATDFKGYRWYVNRQYKGKMLNLTDTFWSTGKDTVSLVTMNCFGRDSFTKIVTVLSGFKKPVADFVSTTNVAEIYVFINFFDLSLNCPTKWHWYLMPDSVYVPGLGMDNTYEYQPGTSDTSQNPSIWFKYPGSYMVCMVASNSYGKDSLCKMGYVYINASAVMCMYPFEYNTLQGTVDDDQPGPGYSGPTASTDCYILINTCGDSVIFTLNNFLSFAGDYLKVYQDNASGKPLWNNTAHPYGIGNGMSYTDAGFQKVFKSGSGQMYIDWFRIGHTSPVSYNPGGFQGVWNTVVLNGKPPIASFTCPDTICLNMPVTFQNTSKGKGVSYLWTFDQSNTSTDSFPTYTYTASAGFTTVKLQASNCMGTSYFSKKIYIEQPAVAPKPNFYANILYPVAGHDNVTFYDSSIGCAQFYKWEITWAANPSLPNTFIPLAGFPNSASPIVMFDSTGYYNITEVVGYNGFFDSITKKLYIKAINYCTPVVQNLNSDIGIGQVTLGSINNSSPIGLTAYSDYTNTEMTYLDIRGSYAITITRNTTFNSMNRKVWIDYNINGSFYDAGELIGTESAANTMTWTLPFKVPANAKPGATRLRIGTSLSNMSNTPCGPNLFGEFEDYRVILRPDATPPVITLIGPSTVYINRCAPSYTDSGATSLDNINGNLTAFMIKSNNINLNKAGTYWYRYDSKDSNNNWAIPKLRTVIVTEDTTKPILTLTGNSVITLSVDSCYSEPGFKAVDLCSGLKQVKTTGLVPCHAVGTFTIIYTATDSAGNQISKTRTIHVKDMTKPSVLLNGANKMSVEVYKHFTDPGVTATDNYDKHLKVIITGKVDTTKVGTDTLFYSVTDSSGNGPIVVSRIVNVIDTIAPVITSTKYNNGDMVTIEVYDVFTAPSMNVTDNYYKTFSRTLSGTYLSTFPTGKSTALGKYTYIIGYTDGSGNYAQFNLLINVVDTLKPVITMVGSSLVTICRFATLTTKEDSAFVTDNYDDFISVNKSLKRTGTYLSDYIPNRNLGFYAIHYNATDASGNKADEEVRYVNVQVCPANSIKSQAGDQINIYPNPNEGEFIVAINLKKTEEVNITVFNSIGQVVKKITRVISGEKVEVNLSGYSSGIYTVKVETSDDIVVRQVTIER